MLVRLHTEVYKPSSESPHFRLPDSARSVATFPTERRKPAAHLQSKSIQLYGSDCYSDVGVIFARRTKKPFLLSYIGWPVSFLYYDRTT